MKGLKAKALDADHKSSGGGNGARSLMKKYDTTCFETRQVTFIRMLHQTRIAVHPTTQHKNHLLLGSCEDRDVGKGRDPLSSTVT